MLAVICKSFHLFNPNCLKIVTVEIFPLAVISDSSTLSHFQDESDNVDKTTKMSLHDPQNRENFRKCSSKDLLPPSTQRAPMANTTKSREKRHLKFLQNVTRHLTNFALNALETHPRSQFKSLVEDSCTISSRDTANAIKKRLSKVVVRDLFASADPSFGTYMGTDDTDLRFRGNAKIANSQVTCRLVCDSPTLEL